MVFVCSTTVLVAFVNGSRGATPDGSSIDPLVVARPVLFVVRQQYRKDHHNTATMFQTGEINTESFVGGGAIKAIDLARGGQVTTLLEVPRGVARDLDLRFDGAKILFSMRRGRADDYHIYEMNSDVRERRLRY
jgi:hypothetical protein